MAVEASDLAAGFSVRGCRRRSPTEREVLADRLYHRLHPIMAALALLFLVVVLAQRAATGGTALARLLLAASWLLWAVFVAEYALRVVIAPDTWAFLRRTWWQVILLAVPFLSMVRVLLLLRVGRPTRVLLAALRGTRSAGSNLSTRAGWLAVTTTIIVFTAADLVYEYGDVRPYGRALHAAAMAAINGEPLPSDRGFIQVLDVALAVYAVVLFASLAGTLGAYFLERRTETSAMASSAVS